MLVALLFALQAGVPAQDTTLPRVTLNQALERATRLDPDYVQALGQVATAEWGRRAAFAVFILPAITLQLDYTKYSVDFFNIGTGQPTSTAANFRANASYEIFSVAKFTDLARTRAEMESAEAGTLLARLNSALVTEADFYDVLANQELVRLAGERVTRAREAFQVARARVLSGAAVQTDSLELNLELTRATVNLLQAQSALRVARLQLGRRIGIPGPVDAVPLDSTMPPDLDLTIDAATEMALAQGPQYRIARAEAQAANALLKGRRGAYLPTLTLNASHVRFDTQLFPSARAVSSIQFVVTLPVWNNAQREIAITQARVNRDVAAAIRDDLERAARVDVTSAIETYRTAVATVALQQAAIGVARESFRVQDARYRAGATTILDFLNAQVALTQSEADLVQARFSARLALAGLEAIIGRRLREDRVLP